MRSVFLVTWWMTAMGLHGSIWSMSSVISAWLESLSFCSHCYKKPIRCVLIHTACWMNSDSSQTLKRVSKGHNLFRERSSLPALYHRMSSAIICWLNEPCLNLSFTQALSVLCKPTCNAHPVVGTDAFRKFMSHFIVHMAQTHGHTLKTLVFTLQCNCGEIIIHDVSHILLSWSLNKALGLTQDVRWMPNTSLIKPIKEFLMEPLIYNIYIYYIYIIYIYIYIYYNNKYSLWLLKRGMHKHFQVGFSAERFQGYNRYA